MGFISSSIISSSDSMTNSYTKMESDGKFATVKTRSIITAHPTTNFKLTKSNDYETIPLQDNISVGNAFSITGGNGILCSKVGVIKVSMKATYDIVASEDVKWGSVWLGTVTVSANSAKGNTGISCVGSDVLVNVTTGQILYLKVQGAIGDVVRGGKEYTHITAEYID